MGKRRHPNSSKVPTRTRGVPEEQNIYRTRSVRIHSRCSLCITRRHNNAWVYCRYPAI